jgi:hypothetical protein
VNALPERGLLRTYLNDHLTGATGMVHRLQMMQDNYGDLPVHAEITQLYREIADECTRLQEIITTLGLSRSAPKMALARVGELAGRLKLNNRLAGRSPLSPLLELELLQSGISGKTGLWRSLATHAASLGLDAQEFRDQEEQAFRQLEIVIGCHRRLVGEAFRPDGANGA